LLPGDLNRSHIGYVERKLPVPVKELVFGWILSKTVG
jgi:hypothetical protein